MGERGGGRHRSIDATPWAEVELQAVYGGTPEENTYSKATPQGCITMTVTNPDAVTLLSPGTNFYVDFTIAE
jgi:hypothetical protein